MHHLESTIQKEPTQQDLKEWKIERLQIKKYIKKHTKLDNIEMGTKHESYSCQLCSNISRKYHLKKC